MAQLSVYISQNQMRDLKIHLLQKDESLSEWARRAVKRELYATPSQRGEDRIEDMLAE